MSSIPQTVQGPHAAQLSPVPATLDAGTRAFLQRYQPLSDAATRTIGNEDADSFVASGLCFADFPCFSVDRVGSVQLGAGNALLDQTHVRGLLDQLTAQPTVTLDQSHPNTVLYGTHAEWNGLTLEIISPPGSASSDFIGGLVFDMYKAVGQGGTANAVRAVPAYANGTQVSPIALCMFPSAADAGSAANFCAGKEPDGSTSSALRRRGFSLGSLFQGFCSVIDLPLLC